MRKFVGRRLFLVIMALGVMVLLAGGSYALSGAAHSTSKAPKVEASESPEPTDTESPEPKDTESPDTGTHGGSIARFHDAGVCNLTDVSKLSGNWTHGDYVSAVAAADPTKVQEAAHSDCGKPVHSGGNNGQKGQHGKSGDPHGKSGQPHGPDPTETEKPDTTK